MDKTPAKRRPQPNPVVERKLCELDACLANALSFRPRLSDAGERLFADIKARTDFLRTLLAAERDCHGCAQLEQTDAEARFAVLENAFDYWANRGIAAPSEEAETEAGSESACSCTESCFGCECTGPEAPEDAKCEVVEEDKVVIATTTRRQRRWWERSAVWCTVAGAVVVVAVGVAIEFAGVGRDNVYVVPT